MSCYRVVRKQFPFIVAEALTNHKSQGDSYECVVVHIERSLPRNALYTALSRAKTASGLFIVGNLKLTNKLSDKDPVFRELKRLREHCSIIWSIPLTSSTVYVHNVRSLDKHFGDILADPLTLESEILVFQETMTTLNDTFDIPGHSLVCRVDGDTRTPGSGTHIYSRNSVVCKSIHTQTSCHNNGMIEIMVVEIFDPSLVDGSVTLVSVYRSPRVPLRDFISAFNEIMTKVNLSPQSIVIGDFNVDLLGMSRDRNMLLEYFESREFYPAISGVSTNYDSQLDCAFTRPQGLVNAISFYESYYSDHKPILITLRIGSDLNLAGLDKMMSPPSVTTESSSNANNDNVMGGDDMDTDVITCQVVIPPPPVSHTAVVGNVTFTYAMRRVLADSINLQHIPIRPTDYTGARITSTQYYSGLHMNLQARFNLRLVPVRSDGNCLFRALSHIIFSDESEHNNVHNSLINIFEQSGYIPTICGLQGYNELSMQRHLNEMRRDHSWGAVNELIMLGMLAHINVSYVNADNSNELEWVITDVFRESNFGIPNDPIFEGRTLYVLFHSINCSGSSGNHFDALYDL